MRRKIIQIADSTQLISLPRQWCISHGLKKGNELEVQIADNCLIISTESTEKIVKSVLDLTKIGDYQDILWHSIYSLYRSGTDELEILFVNKGMNNIDSSKKVMTIEFIQEVITNLIGFEMIHHTSSSCIIRDVVNIKDQEFSDLLRRTFLILIENSKTALEGFRKKNKNILKGISLQDKSINKFTDLCLRMINKGIARQCQKATGMYYIISQLEELGDIFSMLAESYVVGDFSLGNKTVGFLSDLVSLLEQYMRYFYTGRIIELSAIINARWGLESRIRKEQKNLKKGDIFFCQKIQSALTILTKCCEERSRISSPVLD